MSSQRNKTIRGYASFDKAHLDGHDLTLDIDNKPRKGHANIRNWPDELYEQLRIVGRLAESKVSDITKFDPTINP